MTKSHYWLPSYTLAKENEDQLILFGLGVEVFFYLNRESFLIFFEHLRSIVIRADDELEIYLFSLELKLVGNFFDRKCGQLFLALYLFLHILCRLFFGD